MLSVGIVGLPNVGKSTLFNALTAGHAEVSNYPFTTIECNLGVVPVPDERLKRLEAVIHPQKTTPCGIRFADIAGLVRGASQGEGLGNQFLGEIRGVDAVAHVLRGFEDADVAHVLGDVDPIRDADIVETELLLADLEVLERAMAGRDTDWRTRPREHGDERRRYETYHEKLQAGVPLRTLDLDPAEAAELKRIAMLTGKPLLYVLNTADEELGDHEQGWLDVLRERRPQTAAVAIASKLEWELGELEPDERQEFMAELGMETTGLDRLVREAFSLLGLVSFFTIAKSKLQAWEVPAGTPAAAAAGKVHTDMERGFIRAQVAKADDLCTHGSWSALQHAGLVRTVGKDHEVTDGDVIEFLFNV